MKISASDIGWKSEYDEQMYNLMADKGIQGLEIAPTRIFPEDPYSHREQAAKWARALKADFGLAVSSMQSIWYGRNVPYGKNEGNALVDNFFGYFFAILSRNQDYTVGIVEHECHGEVFYDLDAVYRTAE